MAYCKFVLIFAVLMSVGFFSPKPLNDLTVNLDLNEFPKGPEIIGDELETEVKTAKTSGQAGEKPGKKPNKSPGQQRKPPGKASKPSEPAKPSRKQTKATGKSKKPTKQTRKKKKLTKTPIESSLELATIPCKERQERDKPKRRKTRILHGTDVPGTPLVGEPPWLDWIVSIQAEVGTKPNGQPKYECCAGALVSRKHVLTALHCVAYFEAIHSPTGLSTYIMQPVEPENIDISANSLGFLEGTENEAEEIFYKNNSIIFIALTQDTITVDDIALIRLNEEIPNNVPVNPISLPIRPPHDDDDYWMAGWGASQTYPQWVYPDNLKQFLQTKKDKANCLDVPNQLLRPTDKYLCFNRWNWSASKNATGVTSQGTCYGDSGSPGVIFDKTLNKLKWYLQGLHASGQTALLNGYGGCNQTHSYGVDINVWHYRDQILDWMEQQ